MDFTVAFHDEYVQIQYHDFRFYEWLAKFLDSSTWHNSHHNPYRESLLSHFIMFGLADSHLQQMH